MFRTKKKKADGVSRKRKDVDDAEDEGDVVPDAPVFEAMQVEETAGQDSTNNGEDHSTTEDEAAALERMRSRMHKSKARGTSSAMQFSSKSSSKKKPKVVDFGDDEMASVGTKGGGCLSFEEDTASTTDSAQKKRKLRIRPNIFARDEDEREKSEETTTTNMYSEDMLASLLKEQNLLKRRVALDAGSSYVADDGMQDSEPGVHPPSDDEMKGDDVEEFIPLNAKLMQEKKSKKRVTFGLQNDEFYPSKNTVVEEPIGSSESEGDAEEEDQRKRWEDELMRRGGGRPQQSMQTSHSRASRTIAPYPTRRKVPCASLGEVMRSVQRKLDAGRADQERVSRELARLDVEVELIQQSLQKQRDEQLVCSEQFEYFQDVEDYVKGLSFCLREKVPEIEREESQRSSQWISVVKAVRDQRSRDIESEVQLCLQGSTVQARHFVGAVAPAAQKSEEQNDLSVQKAAQDARLARFRQRYSASTQKQLPSGDWELFADVVDDMSSLGHVYGRFQEWKYKFPDVYKNAYCDLALAKLFAPYVRLELINWDPLAATSIMESRRYRVPHMEWFKTLRLHCTQSDAQLEEPVVSLLRDVVVARMVNAAKHWYDPFSPIATQKVADFLEDIVEIGGTSQFEHGIEDIVSSVLGALTNAAKQLPLLALNQQEASVDRVREFASFLVGQLCSLLENTLTLFVALPAGPLHQRGFTAVMQILHHLLAYANHCKHLDKTAILSQASVTVTQLSSSSFMQSILSRSAREQFEFQHVLQLLSSSLDNPAT